ncbi:conserved hypothetical protein [Candidatus Zixiibacteriota bacterium]|nr:conserved hypothetical protein [candidate division Zixibacteria bacterium]
MIYDSLKVFLSSPGDVSNERAIAKEIIHQVGNACKENLGINLDPVDWNDFVPKTTQLPDQRIQDMLNDHLRKCHIFILILWKRYGSKEPGFAKSNTEREVEIALKVLQREKKITFLSYFRDLKPNIDRGPQEKSVTKFRKELEEKGVFYMRYKSPTQFREMLVHDLYKTILNYRLSTKKHISVGKFYNFGIPERPTSPKLAIIYPSMDRSYMGSRDDSQIWLNRLEPNIVFEDFKGLQKIEKTLRLIGFSDFRIYNSASIPSDIKFMNRFWICLRNHSGIAQLRHYSSEARFQLIPGDEPQNSIIKWCSHKKKHEFICVKSPLAAYLRVQRSQFDISGEWKHEMDHIIAKDYAILARFRDAHSGTDMVEGELHDYFMMGLRGLGTWGAGWFIDRKYHHFNSFENDVNMQFLLEVEFRDGRIFDVTDVSSRSQEYFDSENKIETITERINEYKSLL